MKTSHLFKYFNPISAVFIVTPILFCELLRINLYQPLTLSSNAVYTDLSQINPHKVADLDGIPGPVLRACAEKFACILQTFKKTAPCSCSGYDMLQGHRYCSSTKAFQDDAPQRLPPGSTDLHHYEVLRAAGPGTPERHTWPM